MQCSRYSGAIFAAFILLIFIGGIFIISCECGGEVEVTVLYLPPNVTLFEISAGLETNTIKPNITWRRWKADGYFVIPPVVKLYKMKWSTEIVLTSYGDYKVIDKINLFQLSKEGFLDIPRKFDSGAVLQTKWRLITDSAIHSA